MATPSKAYRQGFSAYTDGRTKTANPYRQGTSEADDWQRGWWEAHDAHHNRGVTW